MNHSIKNIATFITHKTVAPWHFKQRQANIIEELLPGATVTICESTEAFRNALHNADAALAWVFKQEWFDDAPNLRILSTPAAGKDYFSVTPPPTVTMLNGHFHGEIIGETVVGMILSMIRGILPNATEFSELPWARGELTPRLRTLRGSNVTILGFGNIGRWIGRLLKPFGVHIHGVCRHDDAARPEYFDDGDTIHSSEDLDQLMPLTDHLVLALPRSTETTDIINARRIEMLPKHATVTNIGRGNAIDENALIRFLKEGRLLGACLDVFSTEPLPYDAPVRSCPRLWCLPHASAIAENYLDLYAREIASDLAAISFC